jgi:orotate phosphoribosyltransferase
VTTATVDRVLALMIETKALLVGHFRLTSGRHSGEYFQCARILERPDAAEELGRMLADRFRNDAVDVVVAPALGGIIIGHEVARALGTRSIFAERESGVMSLRRGFSIKPGERVLVVEDVVTTGGSVKEVAELVKEAGGKVVGFGFLVDRSLDPPGLGERSESLLKRRIDSYEPDQCPLCLEGIPVTKPGSRPDEGTR